MPQTDSDSDHSTMSFGEHLEELRRRMILAILGVVVASFITFPFGKDIVWWLCIPLHRVQRMAGLTPETIAQDVTTAFAIWLKVSIISALLIAGPWVVYQIWKFIASGLYATERRVVYLLAPFSAFMIVLGVSFMYFIMLPVCLTFLIFFSTTYPAAGGDSPGLMDRFSGIVAATAGEQTDNAVDSQSPESSSAPISPEIDTSLSRIDTFTEDPADPIEGQIWFNQTRNEVRLHTQDKTLTLRIASASSMRTLIEVGKYINFVILITLGVVVGFQVPVVMTIAGWTKLVDPKWLAKYRRYCILICFILGALLTPADPISMIVLALPLWGLYELGLVLMKKTYGQGPTKA